LRQPEAWRLSRPSPFVPFAHGIIDCPSSCRTSFWSGVAHHSGFVQELFSSMSRKRRGRASIRRCTDDSWGTYPPLRSTVGGRTRFGRSRHSRSVETPGTDSFPRTAS
jgi:hypothetical protein